MFPPPEWGENGPRFRPCPVVKQGGENGGLEYSER